jgi:hypothetical protein
MEGGMKEVTTTLSLSWEIHDNWTEILAGTYYLLNGPLRAESKKLPVIILARAVIIMSHQLVEMMFFNVARKYIDDHQTKMDKDKVTEIENGLRENIGIKEAMKSWPQMLVGKPFDMSREPFSSQERLRLLRNKTIHWPASHSVEELAHSAYYTGVIASEHVYSHFFKWQGSEYENFTKRYAPSVDIFLVRQMQHLKKAL